ncbi:hypothetical protein D3C72_463990 [compost metagenome]
MKTIIGALGICFLLSGCATSSISTVSNDKAISPYNQILTLYTDAEFDFYQLDSVTYEQNFRRKINNLSDYDYRKQLEKTLRRNLNGNQTRIVKSTEIFKVNEDIPYGEFKTKIQNAEVDAILIINMKNYWYSKSVKTDIFGQPSVSEDPNAAFLSYLYDVKSNKTVWMAKSVVSGMLYAGYETLNNMMARRVARKLSKGKYISEPQLYAQN